MVKILELEQITCNGMRNSIMTTFESGPSKLRDGEINLKDMHDESCSSCSQKQKFLPETNDTCTKSSSSLLRFIKGCFKASTSKIMIKAKQNYKENQTEESVLNKVRTSGTKRAKSCGHIEKMISLRSGKFKTKIERRSKLGKCESEPLQKYKTTEKVITTKRAVRKITRIANTGNVIYLCIFHKRKRRKQSSQTVQTEPLNSTPTAQSSCDPCNVRYNTVFWASELVAVKQSTSESYYDSSEEALSKNSSTCCYNDKSKRLPKFPVPLYHQKSMVNALGKKTISNHSPVCLDSDQTKTETEYDCYGERSEEKVDVFKKMSLSKNGLLCLDNEQSKYETKDIIKPLTSLYDRISERNVNSLNDIPSKRNSLGWYGRNVKVEIYNVIQSLCKKSWFGKSFRKKAISAEVQVTPVTESVRQREVSPSLDTSGESCNCSEIQTDSIERYTTEVYKPKKHGSYKRRVQSEASDKSAESWISGSQVDIKSKPEDVDSTTYVHKRLGSCGFYGSSCRPKPPKNKYDEYHDEEEESVPETSKSDWLDENIETEGDSHRESSSKTSASSLRKGGTSRILSEQGVSDEYDEITKKQTNSSIEVILRASDSFLHLDRSRIKSHDRQETLTEKSKPEAHEGRSKLKADSDREVSPSSRTSHLQDGRYKTIQEVPTEKHKSQDGRSKAKADRRKEMSPKSSAPRLQAERSKMKSRDKEEISAETHWPEVHDGRSKTKVDSRRKVSSSFSESCLQEERNRMKRHDENEISTERHTSKVHNGKEKAKTGRPSKMKSRDQKEIPTQKHKTEYHDDTAKATADEAQKLPPSSSASHLQGKKNKIKSHKENQTEKDKAEVDGSASELHASRSLLDIPSERRRSDMHYDRSKTDTDNARKVSITPSEEDRSKQKGRSREEVLSEKNTEKVKETDSASKTQAFYCSSCCPKAKAKPKVAETVEDETKESKPSRRKESGEQTDVYVEKSMTDRVQNVPSIPSVSHAHPDKKYSSKASKESLFDAISEQDEKILPQRTSTESISHTKDEATACVKSSENDYKRKSPESTKTTPSITRVDKKVQSTKENILLPDLMQNEKNVLEGIAALLNQIFQELCKHPFRKCVCKISQTANKQGLLNATNLGKGYQAALYVIRKKMVQDEESLVPTKLGEPRKMLSISTDKLKLEIKTDEDGDWLIDRVGNLEMTITEKEDARARFVKNFAEKPTNTDRVQFRCTSCHCILAGKPDIPKDTPQLLTEIKSSDKPTSMESQTQKATEVASAKSFDYINTSEEIVPSQKVSKSIQKTPESVLPEKTSAKTQTVPEMVLLEEYSGPIKKTSQLVPSEKSSKPIQQIPEIVITEAPSKQTLKPPQQTLKVPAKYSKQTHTTPPSSKSTLKPIQQKSESSGKSSHHIQETPKQVHAEKQVQERPKTKPSETPELQPHAVIHVYKKVAGAEHLPDDDPRKFVVKIRFHASDSDAQSEEIESCFKEPCPGKETCCRCDRKRTSPPMSALLFKQMKSTTTEDTHSPSSGEKCSFVDLGSLSQESYMKKVKICVPKRNAGSQALIKHHIMQQCPEMVNVKSQTRKPCVKCACPAVSPILPDGQKTCCS